jgi:hypothetical protein
MLARPLCGAKLVDGASAGLNLVQVNGPYGRFHVRAATVTPLHLPGPLTLVVAATLPAVLMTAAQEAQQAKPLHQQAPQQDWPLQQL